MHGSTPRRGDTASPPGRDRSSDSVAATWRLASPITSSRSEHTHEILVTQAERPHPFPSRTRKLSSPAPKILRGQPLGKIGRRRGLLRARSTPPAPLALRRRWSQSFGAGGRRSKLAATGSAPSAVACDPACGRWWVALHRKRRSPSDTVSSTCAAGSSPSAVTGA